MQEEAAEKFDRIFDGDVKQKSNPNVSKMLANGEEVECRLYRFRTCDTLIKSQVDILAIFGVFSKLESAYILFLFKIIRLTLLEKSG